MEKTVREFIDTLHERLLKSFTRGASEGQPDEIDHWGRLVTDADVTAIKERTATIADALVKE